MDAHRGSAATASAAIAANRALTVFAYRIVIRWALFVESRTASSGLIIDELFLQVNLPMNGTVRLRTNSNGSHAVIKTQAYYNIFFVCKFY